MIFIAISIIIIILLLLGKKENKTYSQESVKIEENFSIDSNELKIVESKNEYIDISQCVYRYFNYIRDANAASLIELLDESYVKEKNISENNIFKYTYNSKNTIHYFIKDIRVKYDSNINHYIAECNISNENREESIFLIISVDNVNMSFCILPVTKKYENIDEIPLNNELKSIKQKQNNKYIRNYVNDETICKFLLDDYINKAVYFPREIYKSLDEEFKVKRFPEYENFNEYIENNKKRLEASILDDIMQPSDFKDEEEYVQYLSSLDRVQLDKYLVESNEEGKKYICVDKNECYYIFIEKSPMKFSLILDTYTLPSEKFKSTYSKGNEQVKMQLNIDKFIKMVNNKDYTNAYKLLDDGFKTNYFKTEDKFEEFLKNKFYEFNIISFEKFSNEGEILIYEVTITNKSGINTKGILNFNIIMKLQNEYEFTISFGMV